MRKMYVCLVFAALLAAAVPATSEAGIFFHRRGNDCCCDNGCGCCNTCGCNYGCSSCGYTYRGCRCCGHVYNSGCGCGYVYNPGCGCGYACSGWQYVSPGYNYGLTYAAPGSYYLPTPAGYTPGN